jgi:hypothetical protein
MKKASMNKTMFDRTAFNETVDVSFSQLNKEPDPSTFDRDLASLEDFWYLYEKFFYDIPKLGDINSHEYLARQSGEYANAEQINTEIQALIEEISSLREQNLSLLQDALDAGEAEQTTNVNT